MEGQEGGGEEEGDGAAATPEVGQEGPFAAAGREREPNETGGGLQSLRALARPDRAEGGGAGREVI